MNKKGRKKQCKLFFLNFCFFEDMEEIVNYNVLIAFNRDQYTVPYFFLY